MLRHVSSLAAPPRSVNTLCTAVTARAFSVDASGPAAKKPRNTQPYTPLPVPGVRPHDQKSRPTVVFDRSRPPFKPSSVKPPLKSTSAQSSSSKFKSTKPPSKFSSTKSPAKFASTRPPSSGPPRTKPLYGKPPAEKPPSTKSSSYESPPSRITDDGPKRLLRAPVLAQRLQNLTVQGKLEEAADMLQNTPLDAQNTVVWNGLLKDFLRAEKYQRAFELYVDMKRRGFVPNARTYQTLLQGLSAIRDWNLYPKQLENARKIFASYKEHMQALKEQDRNHPDISTNPYTSFIEILSSAGRYQEMFDVYNGMDQEGPLAPNAYTFAAMQFAVNSRRTHEDGTTGTKAFHQNAADARLIWRQAVKAAERNGWDVDAHVVASTLRALSMGKPTDHLMAFEIVREYAGFAKPGEQPLPPKVKLSPPLLSAILTLCNLAQKYRFCLNILQQLMERDDPVLDTAHIVLGLRANAATAAIGSMDEPAQAYNILLWIRRRYALERIPSRPDPGATRLALVSCWRGKDWATALKITELMMGYKGEEFVDGQPKPRRREVDERIHILPDRSIVSLLGRTAVATQDPHAMRQCLRLFEVLLYDSMLRYTPSTNVKWDAVEGMPRSKVQSAKSNYERQFYTLELARAIVDLIKVVIKKKAPQSKEVAPSADAAVDEYVVTDDEQRRWMPMYAKARTALRETPSMDFTARTHKPFAEDNLLGSEMGISAMDRHVDYEMTFRHVKSASVHS